MHIIAMLTFLVLLSAFFYIRYVPVRGVQCISAVKPCANNIKIVDVRDYNFSYKDPVPGAVNIPVAYLRRNYQMLTKDQLVIIASDELEKNISIRFLRNKGCKIIGYKLTNCKCKDDMDGHVA